jgi:23S rRNA (pseudouridine1915-N3)-methyltransferase
VVVGRLREDFWKAAEAEYLKRLRPYCKLTVRELKEDAALGAALPKDGVVVALDEGGELVSTREFAALLGDARDRGAELSFVIGGADGLDEAAKQRANRVIAFGRMTMAHRLVRIVLVEQIYRGFTVLSGHPYHR